VLLLLTAGSLVGALGLAWVQVRGSRALGDEVRIEGTPLIVRPPAGWVAGRDHRGVFVKTIEIGYRGRQHEAIERSIKFEYRRWDVFQPLPDLLRLANWLDDKQAYEPVPAQIGGLNGVQVRRSRVFRWRGRQERGETIYRLVSTARGDQISVEYTPLGEVSPGDMELFDAVCRAVKLTDPAVSVQAEAALAHAGVRFSPTENWTILNPDYPEIPGLYIQNHDANRIPVWGLAVFRTWLAPGRNPLDLLTSFAELEWPPEAIPDASQQWTRSDGAIVATLGHGAMRPRGGHVASAWVVSKSPAEAVLIFALADSQAAPAADQAAGMVAEEIEFLTSYPPDGLAVVDDAGRELAALIRQEGAAPWWGASESTLYYYGELSGVPLMVESSREPIGGDPSRGYAGYDRYDYRDPAKDRNHAWGVDGNADAYVSRVEADFDPAWRPQSVLWEESRDAGESVIQRPVATASRSDVLRIPVGAAFVCPPVETLAYAWVAQQAEGTWLIEASRLRGSQTHTQLLIPLEPDADSRTRVLLVDDYWPRGMVLTFDSDLELVRQVAPIGYFERMTRQQAQDVLRALGRP
jgi:hypothetical protein